MAGLQYSAEREDNDDDTIHIDNGPEICAICLGEFEDPTGVTTLTTCHHRFCTSCIREWVACRSRGRNNAICPTCRAPIAHQFVNLESGCGADTAVGADRHVLDGRVLDASSPLLHDRPRRFEHGNISVAELCFFFISILFLSTAFPWLLGWLMVCLIATGLVGLWVCIASHTRTTNLEIENE